MTFGSRLKKLRQNYNMTQQDLATAIRLSKANVSKYESDQIQPSMETIVIISELFNVSIDYLLGKPTIISIAKSNGIKSPGDAPTDVITKHVDLSDAEKKILDACENLSPEQLEKVVEYVEFISAKKRSGG